MAAGSVSRPSNPLIREGMYGAHSEDSHAALLTCGNGVG